MRLAQRTQSKGRHRLFTPFLNSPAFLTLYLLALIACIVLLEIVTLKAGEAPTGKDLQARDVVNEIRGITILNTALEVRQDDSGDDGSDTSDTSDSTDTDSSSDTSNDDDTSDGSDNSGADDTDGEDDTPVNDDTSDDEADDPDDPNDSTVDDPVDDNGDTTEDDSGTNNGDDDQHTDSEDQTTDDTHDSGSETSTDASTTTKSDSSTSTTDSAPETTETTSTDDKSSTEDSSDDEDDGDDDDYGDDEDDNGDSSTTAAQGSTAAVGNSTTSTGFASLFHQQHKALPLPPSVQPMPVKVNTLVKFTATYAAIIIAIAFKTCWLIIFASFKLNEPFYQLTRPGGASNPETGMLFEFLATGFPVDHFKAGFVGNWTSWYMMTSYAALLLLLIIPSLAAEAFSVQNVKGQCLDTHSKTGHCVSKVWTVATKPVRTLQITFIVLAVLVFVILVIRVRRSSYYQINKISLSTVANTLQDPETLEVFRSIPPRASRSEMERIVNCHQYKLDWVQPVDGVDNRSSYILHSTPSDREQGVVPRAYLALVRFLARIEPWLPTLDLALPMGIAMFLFSIIASYASGRINHSALTLFFMSPRFGPKFFLTGVTTLLGIALCRVEYEVRILTTYRSLFLADEPSKLLERSLHGSPYTQTFASLFRRNEWVCALVSGMAGPGILVLSIVIGNVPWHPGQSPRSALACIATSLALLMLMIISLCIVAFWRRQNARLHEYERLPGTLADICVLMAHGRVPGVALGVEEEKEYQEESNEKLGEKQCLCTVTVREL